MICWFNMTNKQEPQLNYTGVFVNFEELSIFSND